jgi:hypothetical protein
MTADLFDLNRMAENRRKNEMRARESTSVLITLRRDGKTSRRSVMTTLQKPTIIDSPTHRIEICLAACLRIGSARSLCPRDRLVVTLIIAAVFIIPLWGFYVLLG